MWIRGRLGLCWNMLCKAIGDQTNGWNGKTSVSHRKSCVRVCVCVCVCVCRAARLACPPRTGPPGCFIMLDTAPATTLISHVNRKTMSVQTPHSHPMSPGEGGNICSLGQSVALFCVIAAAMIILEPTAVVRGMGHTSSGQFLLI